VELPRSSGSGPVNSLLDAFKVVSLPDFPSPNGKLPIVKFWLT